MFIIYLNLVMFFIHMFILILGMRQLGAYRLKLFLIIGDY